MPHKSKLIILLTLMSIVLLISMVTQNAKIEFHLSVTLMPHYPQSPVTYGLVKTKAHEILEHQTISEREFVLIGAGAMKRKCNPDLKNLFQEHGITNCSTTYDAPFNKFHVVCPLTDRIWRVRYDTLPGSTVNPSVKDYNTGNLGWANGKHHPSEGQMAILSRYGIQNVSNAIYGDSLWQFLSDINDQSWINNYRAH